MSLAYVIVAYSCLNDRSKADVFFTSFFGRLLWGLGIRD